MLRFSMVQSMRPKLNKQVGHSLGELVAKDNLSKRNEKILLMIIEKDCVKML